MKCGKMNQDKGGKGFLVPSLTNNRSPKFTVYYSCSYYVHVTIFS